MIFRFDGHFPAGETQNNMVVLEDLYQYSIICELTGVTVPGRSARDS